MIMQVVMFFQNVQEKKSYAIANRSKIVTLLDDDLSGQEISEHMGRDNRKITFKANVRK